MNHIILFLCFTIPPSIVSLNVLLYNPMFGFSHAKFLSKLADVLADHGHQVTSLQPFHVDVWNTQNLIKSPTVEVINYYPDNFKMIQESPDFDYSIFWDTIFERNPLLDAIVFSEAIAKCFNNTAFQLIRDTKLHNTLQSRNFDVMLYEPFDLTGVYLASLINISTIPVLTQVRYEFIETLFGSPTTLGYVPYGSSNFPEKGFMDRLKNIIWYHCIGAKMHWLFSNQQNNLEVAIGKELPSWRHLLPSAPLLFANANPYLDFAVPTTKNIVNIGGITMDSKKMRKVEKLPEEYEKILQERDSTVLISFGSVMRSFEMPERFKSGILNMIGTLPNITFIWKYEMDDVEFQKRLPENVHLKKWVPQSALLSDERLKLFITHGGLGSTMEIAYTAKPAIAVPIFGDQHLNSMMLASHGGAVVYDKYDLENGEKLTSTVKEVLENPKCQKSGDTLFEVLRTAPYDPEKEFLEKLDFAVRFPQFRSFSPAISQQGIIAFYHIDAFLVVILIAIIIFSISIFGLLINAYCLFKFFSKSGKSGFFKISVFGILINAFCLFKFLSKSGKFSGFFKLCIAKTIPNLLICAIFLFWSTPLTLLHMRLVNVPRSVNVIMGQIAGSGAYTLAPIIQSFMATNRFVILYTPFWRLKLSKLPVTNIAIAFGVTVSFICSVLGYEEACGYIFDPETLVWRSEEVHCAEQQSAIIFLCVVVPTVCSNILNALSAIKLICSKVSGITKSAEKRRQRKWAKMFLQNAFQDCLHIIDLINCRYIYALREETWFQFIFLSTSFISIYSLDGFVMFCFHRDVQPKFIQVFFTKNHFLKKTNAVEAFRSMTSS